MAQLQISERTTYQGGLVLSCYVNDYIGYVERQYMYYTKKEARQLFKAYIKGLLGGGR